MNHKPLLTGVSLIAVALAAGSFVAGSHADRLSKTTNDEAPADDVKVAPADEKDPGGIAGGVVDPDVVVGSMNGTSRWTTSGGQVSYSFGTTSCNIGTTPLNWDDGGGNNQYPVIGQNLYKLDGNGRFKMIGMGWLKHAFCALQNSNICGAQACQPVCGGCCDELGPGCSDPYTSGLNGSQSGLGPRWQVNAFTGEHPDLVNGNLPPITTLFSRRVIVDSGDVDPTSNPDAFYFIEGQYVAEDDASAGNHFNNSSWRRVTVGSFPYNLSMTGATMQQEPAIFAWKSFDPDNSVTIREIGPNSTQEGLYVLGFDVIQDGPMQYRYEYALYNHNSHRSAQSFAVPIGADVQIFNTGFHDIEYHSGEKQECPDGTGAACAWTATVDQQNNVITWTMPDNGNPDPDTKNALRWGTMYNFWFTADTPPVANTIEVEFFQASDPPVPGEPASFFVGAKGPDDAPGGGCAQDLNDDGEVGVPDLVEVISNWGACPGCPADFNGDDQVDVTDLVDLISNWGACP